jgi:hypothetical protein
VTAVPKPAGRLIEERRLDGVSPANRDLADRGSANEAEPNQLATQH